MNCLILKKNKLDIDFINLNLNNINFANLKLLNPYTIYDIIRNINHIKINNTIILGDDNNEMYMIPKGDEKEQALINKYDLYILKYDKDEEEIIGLDDDEINKLLECINKMKIKGNLKDNIL